jgi:hypothetical protein
MNSMIKLLSIALISLLSSCASVDYSYFSDFKRLLARNTIAVSDSYISNMKYSFIKVSHARNEAIFVLSDVSSTGIHTWIGANYEVIKTKHGLIVETRGLDSDIKFYSSGFNDMTELSNYSSYINLYNPDLVYEKIIFNTKDINTTQPNKSDLDLKVHVVELERQVLNIGWASKDTYFYKNGIIIKSIQKTNPLRDHFTINFYYKF